MFSYCSIPLQFTIIEMHINLVPKYVTKYTTYEGCFAITHLCSYLSWFKLSWQLSISDVHSYFSPPQWDGVENTKLDLGVQWGTIQLLSTHWAMPNTIPEPRSVLVPLSRLYTRHEVLWSARVSCSGCASSWLPVHLLACRAWDTKTVLDLG